jgi:hypothetical protein
MSLAVTTPQDRLMRFSRAMIWLTTGGIALIVVLTVAGVCLPGWMRNIALAKLGAAGASLPITPLGQALAGVALAIPVGVMLYGLFAVRRMFVAFARGEVFSAHTAHQLQIFAASVLLQSPLGPLTSAALSAALSVGNPPGERAIMIAFSINDYFALIIGCVLFAAATIMREGARIAEENASFV